MFEGVDSSAFIGELLKVQEIREGYENSNVVELSIGNAYIGIFILEGEGFKGFNVTKLEKILTKVVSELGEILPTHILKIEVGLIKSMGRVVVKESHVTGEYDVLVESR